MALSPYIKPSVLNGGLFGSPKGLTGAYANSYGTGKDFDKRNGSSDLTERISNFKTVMEMLANTVGTRSPYYKIGEIQGTAVGQWASRYLQNSLGNVVRAITDVVDAVTGDGQPGVVIDGFGTVSGKIDVELTKNPVVFVSNAVTDSRMRNPNTVDMTVYVSNYYNDDGLGAAVDYLTAFDPRGIAKEAINVLANGGNTRAQGALYNLRRIQEQGKPFTVYTPHGVYENMLIKSISPRTTAENVDMLECDIVFQELIMYEPYYDDESAKKFPIRTNILSSDDASTLTKLTSKSTYTGAFEKVTNFADSINFWSSTTTEVVA